MKSKTGYALTKGWYYIYIPELGTDPLTVTLLRKEAWEGKLMGFPSGVILIVDLVDNTNRFHPYLICDVVEGDLNRMQTGVVNYDTYNLKRIENRGNRSAYAYRRNIRIMRFGLRSRCRRLLRRPNGISKDLLPTIEMIKLTLDK